MKLALILSVFLAMAAAGSIPAKEATFALELFDLVAADKLDDNIVISPASIQSCLAMTYMGAEGETANQMKLGLKLSGSSKQEVGEVFANQLKQLKQEDSKLKMANRIYVGQNYELSAKFNELSSKYFNAAAESVNFGDAQNTANKINQWVEQQTENKIKDLISSSSLDTRTAAVLVNALYFKASWANNFDKFSTKMKPFTMRSGNKIDVDMMFQEDNFNYGELKDLDAHAVEMEYLDTDVTMLLILPNKHDGLQDLEKKLQTMDLIKLSEGMQDTKLRLSMPKFKIEYDLSMESVLQKMGMKDMFTPAADFSSLVTGNTPLSISEVKHKAFIEVNEQGTEAGAATYAKAVLLSYIFNEVIKDMVIDHPFFFALKDKQTVYFAGHVTKF